MTRFTLQISDQLNQWLTEQARLNHRSKNKQIEFLLAEARNFQDGRDMEKKLNDAPFRLGPPMWNRTDE